MPKKNPQLLEISRKAEKKIHTDKGYLLGGVAVFLREYGEEYSRSRFIRRLRSATYETLRDEARRQQRGSSDVAHALAITKLYNLTGGRGTVDPRRLTVLD